LQQITQLQLVLVVVALLMQIIAVVMVLIQCLALSLQLRVAAVAHLMEQKEIMAAQAVEITITQPHQLAQLIKVLLVELETIIYLGIHRAVEVVQEQLVLMELQLLLAMVAMA
jgi:hypothetical protein